jgi:hypothetical protein
LRLEVDSILSGSRSRPIFPTFVTEICKVQIVELS